MAKKIRLLGILAIVLGVIASASTIILMNWPGKTAVVVSVSSGFLGFLSSTIYTLLNTKHEVNKHPFNPGFVGLLLSSAPMISFFILLNK
jgi:LytS/YehU family sensor histidine kinase